MPTATATISNISAQTQPITTAIVGKFQLTVPAEIREHYGLKPGDIFEWQLDHETGYINLLPKRAQLITPQSKRRLNQFAEQA